ncbi:MAG: OmpA family protein [Ignavibacteriaceae bacterium]
MISKLITFLTVLLIFSFSAQAQFKDWGTKLGLRYNQLFPENEFKNIGFGGKDKLSFDDYQFSYLALADAFISFELNKSFELQLNIGYGSYSGKDNLKSLYRTEIIPIDIRLRLSPFDMKGWNPYVYAGGGFLHYNVLDEPDQISYNLVKRDDWVGVFPVGIGSEFAITQTLLLNIAIGGAMTTTYDLDYYHGKDPGTFDSYFIISTGLTFTGESGSSDRDSDGLSKDEEEEIGTNPKNKDSDGDGLNDGDEVTVYKTNPLQADSDLDGLSDYDEVMKYKTNPLKADTDGDGLNDGDEINKYKSDPSNPDSDGDGLNDGDELIKYRTDLLNSDSDNDGLTDDKEVHIYKTNPLNPDSDYDGLSDYDEVITYKTDPNKSDTDNGSVNDGAEIKRGTDPLNPEDDFVKLGAPVILEGITFERSKASINPESEETLREVLKSLQTYSDIYVEISGYTDKTGSKNLNQKLSQERADAVRNWLISKGIEPKRIIAHGYGSDKPIDSNQTEEGRSRNRRIEFKRIK